MTFETAEKAEIYLKLKHETLNALYEDAKKMQDAINRQEALYNAALAEYYLLLDLQQNKKE
jgi:hypothetical protein